MPSPHPREGWVLQAIHPVSQLPLYQPWIASALGEAPLLSCSARKVRLQICFFGSPLFHSINDFPSGCCLVWLSKLNIAANCKGANLSATEKKKMPCILVQSKAIVGHFKN